MNTKYLASLALAIAFTGFAAAPIGPDPTAASSQTQPRASSRAIISQEAEEKFNNFKKSNPIQPGSGKFRRLGGALNVEGIESLTRKTPQVNQDTTTQPRLNSELLATLGHSPQKAREDKSLPLAPGLVKQ